MDDADILFDFKRDYIPLEVESMSLPETPSMIGMLGLPRPVLDPEEDDELMDCLQWRPA